MFYDVLMLMISWFIGALILVFIVHPYMVHRKLDKEGLSMKNIKKEIKQDIVGPLSQKIDDQADLSPFRAQLEDGFAVKLEEKTDELKGRITADLQVIQANLPAIFHNYIVSEQGQTTLQETFNTASKSLIGAIYGEIGVEEKAFKAGMKKAKEWIVSGGNGGSIPQRRLRDILTDIVGPKMADNVDQKLGALIELKQHMPELLGKGGIGRSSNIPSGGNELVYY